jgi:hypothetical protein
LKRLKPKQKHGCDWCRDDGLKVPGVYRNMGFNKVACEDHLPELLTGEKRQAINDSYQTDAEFQLGV